MKDFFPGVFTTQSSTEGDAPVDAKKAREIAAKAKEDARKQREWERSPEGRAQRRREEQKREEELQAAWDREIQPYIDGCLKRIEKAAENQEHSITFSVGKSDEGEAIRDAVAARLTARDFLVAFWEDSYYKKAVSEWDDYGYYYELKLEIFWREEDLKRWNRKREWRQSRWRVLLLLILLCWLMWKWWPVVLKNLQPLLEPDRPTPSDTRKSHQH